MKLLKFDDSIIEQKKPARLGLTGFENLSKREYPINYLWSTEYMY